jgi:flagellar biosynthesis GTPase FlhF
MKRLQIELDADERRAEAEKKRADAEVEAEKAAERRVEAEKKRVEVEAAAAIRRAELERQFAHAEMDEQEEQALDSGDEAAASGWEWGFQDGRASPNVKSESVFVKEGDGGPGLRFSTAQFLRMLPGVP